MLLPHPTAFTLLSMMSVLTKKGDVIGQKGPQRPGPQRLVQGTQGARKAHRRRGFIAEVGGFTFKS